MFFLILNSGSSSLKFQVIEMAKEEALFKGIVDGIGQDECFLKTEDKDGKTQVLEQKVPNHEEALALVLAQLKNAQVLDKINAIGHRVVHGGEKYRAATLVSDKVLADIQELSDLAPLHNPANLSGIYGCKKFFPNIPNIAVFDTAFHQTLPAKAYLYGLPYELYEKFRIRKYGFHGISHQYVSQEAMKVLKENIKDFKILSCHLGAGASICAILKGKSVEISMGFTPLEGLMMGTRAGSFDPEIIIYLLRKGYKLELAFEMFVYRIQRFIGSYSAVLGGLEILIFTGGVGEKAYYLRKRVCEPFGYLSLKLDSRKNKANETIISTPDSEVTTLVIPSNEELQIARESYQLLKT